MEPRIAILGAGYVGLPLAVELAAAGQPVVCIDPAAEKVQRINHGDSYIGDVPSERLRELIDAGLLRATTSPAAVTAVRDIVICVGTPLTPNREPDLSSITR